MKAFYDSSSLENQALSRSSELISLLKQKMFEEGHAISFATFMELALYHPTLGYYNKPDLKFDKQGDFITAPEISPLYAKCFAQPCLQILRELKTGSLLELGAGSGKLAFDLLSECNKAGILPEYYYIYEISPVLRMKQQAFLQTACPELFSKIKWIDSLPTHFTGIVLANEVLDAMPVHCFTIEENDVKERCVTFDNEQFVWTLRNISNPEFASKTAIIRELYELDSGYQSEINLGLSAFIKRIANMVNKGVIFFADYGYGQREYYHPERKNGTLTCFYQRTYHDNPLVLPGLQDMTAHVDFTTVIESAAEEHCTLQGYTTQAAFLFACGLMDFAAQAECGLDRIAEFNLHQAIKLLTLPTEMGERIKIMGLSKNIDFVVQGFELQDRSREL